MRSTDWLSCQFATGRTLMPNHCDADMSITGPAEALGERFVQAANRLPTLFDLDDMAVAILALLDDAESAGEEPIDGLEAQLALVEEALAHKVENYVSVIRQLEHLAGARKAEADRLRKRAATSEGAADWLKARLKAHMELTGQQRIETTRFTVALHKNPPRVDVLEAMMVPEEFKKTVISTSVDKRAVLDHFKRTGEEPSGVAIVRNETHVRFL